MRSKSFFAAAWLLAIATPALAHSFDTIIIAPQNDAAARADIQTAFLIASSETDGHANEESDGHLGGLDVYLTILTAPEFASQRPAFVAVPLPLPAADALNSAISASGAVPVPPQGAKSAKSVQFLSTAAAPGLAPFATRFKAKTGRQPGPVATATYVAARRIDMAVRAAGDASDPQRLRALIMR